MKKILFLFIFAGASIVSKAQTEKGTWLLGGGVSFTHVEELSTFSFDPDMGYFVANNFALGLSASLTTSDGNTSWGVGPFGRYYFTKNTQGKPFAGVGLLFGGASHSDTNTGFGVEAGYSLFLNRSIALEFGAQYTRFAEMNIIGAGVGFQIHFKK